MKQIYTCSNSTLNKTPQFYLVRIPVEWHPQLDFLRQSGSDCEVTLNDDVCQTGVVPVPQEF